MGRIVTGFIAAMLAVVFFHQPIGLLCKYLGLIPQFNAYSMAAHATAVPAVAAFFKGLGFAGWPVMFNNLFWGGLLGGLFGLINHKLPSGIMMVKGLIFGLIVVVVSNWLLLPFIQDLRGIPNQVYFAGFNPMRMLAGAMIVGGFGLGTGLFYGILRRNA